MFLFFLQIIIHICPTLVVCLFGHQVMLHLFVLKEARLFESGC